MARISTLRSARLPVGLAIAALFSCTGDTGTGMPGADLQAQLAVVLAFPSAHASASSASDPQPIVAIRVTTFVVPPETQIAQVELSVDPNADEWSLDIKVPLSADPGARYLFQFELLNAGGEVEWSGTIGPLSLGQSVTTVVRTVAVVRGPLDNLSVTALSVSGPASVLEGGSFSLTANVQTSGGSNTKVFWRSLTPAIASVDASGNGVGLSPGTAEIQAEAGTLTAVHSLVVIGAPVGVVIGPETSTLSAPGETITFDASVIDSRGNPTGDPVSFSVADGRVLTDLGDGVFQAVGGGETTVTATAVENLELSATASVMVDLTPVAIVIDPSEAVLISIGATAALEIIGSDAQDTPIFGLSGSWSSSDPTTVSVNQHGVVTGLVPGTAVITAEVDGLTADALVTVTPVVASLTITPLDVTLTALGETQQYEAEALDAGGTPVAGAPLAWTSSDEVVATINSAGLATAMRRGMTTITVMSGGVSASAKLEVKQPLDRVEVSPSSTKVKVGAEVRFKATAFDPSGEAVEGVEFEWASSDSKLLIMFLGGLVLGNGVGDVIVTATTPDGLVGTADVTVVPALPRSLGVVVVANTDGDDVNFLRVAAGTNTQYDCTALSTFCNNPRNLRVNAAGTFAAVPFRHSDKVGIFDLNSPGFVQVITDASFDEPYALAFTSDGSELWAASKKGGDSSVGTVSIVNMASRTVVAVMNDTDFVSPEGFNILGDRAFVANRQGGTLTILSVSGRSVLQDVSVSGEPRDVVVTPGGKFAYVTSDRGTVTKVRVSDGMTTVISISGSSRNLAISPDGSKVFVATQNNRISVIDVGTDAVREIIFAGAFTTYGVAILRDGSSGFVTDVPRDLVYRFNPNAEVEIIDGNFPADVGSSPRGITAH